MRSVSKIEAAVAPHLPAGERFIAAFQAECGVAIGLAHKWRIVAVTDHAIHVYTASWFSTCKPKTYLYTLPPGTVLEPEPHLVLRKVLYLGPERLWVNRPWWKELDRAVEASVALHRGYAL